MVSLIVQGLVGCAVLALWKILKRILFKSPLKNIPGPPALSLAAGNVQQLFDAYGWDFYYGILKRYGSVIKIQGLFGEPMLLLHDPRALHHILVKDQDTYEETTAFITLNKLVFGDSLLSTLGEQHRKQRKMLNPVFSIAHMREMVPTFYEVTTRLRQAILNQVNDGSKEIDISTHSITVEMLL